MLAFVGVTGARTTFSWQTANVVLYLFSCEPRNPIPKLRLSPPLAGAGHRGYDEPRGAKRSKREERIVGLLNRGASVPEIAACEGLTLKRMRNVVREILSERMPQPPAEFLALQVSLLNEALLVSFSAMHNAEKGTNFED